MSSLKQHTETLLDYIITNESLLEVTPGIINYRISNHDAIFAVINTKNKPVQNKSKSVDKITFRCLKNFDVNDFRKNLKTEPEFYINHIPDITPDNYNNEFDKFRDIILNVVNKHAPLKTASRKQKRLQVALFIKTSNPIFCRQKEFVYNLTLLSH